MHVSEIFYSIQGEGKLSGIPSAFIRTTGCNLRCTWCDTPYTSWEPRGNEISVDQILATIADFPTRYVVLTGGEPMIAPEIGELSSRLHASEYHVTIETAATVWTDVACDLASISPKLSNSTPWEREGGKWGQRHEDARINEDTIRRFMAMPDYQLKFVIDQPDDLTEVDELLSRVDNVEPSSVLLMPQGVTSEELDQRGKWVADICKDRGFRFCPRLHIALYGNTPGT